MSALSRSSLTGKFLALLFYLLVQTDRAGSCAAGSGEEFSIWFTMLNNSGSTFPNSLTARTPGNGITPLWCRGEFPTSSPHHHHLAFLVAIVIIREIGIWSKVHNPAPVPLFELHRIKPVMVLLPVPGNGITPLWCTEIFPVLPAFFYWAKVPVRNHHPVDLADKKRSTI